uniref:Histidine-containing phosphotransfer protein n=2 Tax=Salix viminalis TaxID=40686 RepID=A0A6N2LKE4_SALVM
MVDGVEKNPVSKFCMFLSMRPRGRFILQPETPPKRTKMEGSNVWQEQRNFVKSLHEQGILDSQFEDILDLPRESPQFVIDLVSTFCSDAENAIAALIRYINEPDINYRKIIDKVHLIRGASSCIGGHRMALACRELRYACEDKDKDRCLAAFVKTGDEYQILKEKFNIILQMERAMIYGKSKTG